MNFSDEVWDEVEIFMEVMDEIKCRKAKKRMRQRKLFNRKNKSQQRNWKKWKRINKK
ncbi:hypothetical protein M3215_07085 [Bacillus cytotoxicus]|uniref:Uncharacterized protein n=1 Tax=Bacillus cytotoxicus TaxID=580165 RepID=A0ACC6A4L4_9BACI|nr:hypothetical protein [Bacillus cytotoxicus]